MARTKNSARKTATERRPRVVAVPSKAMVEIDERVRQTASHRKRKQGEAAELLGEASTIASNDMNDNSLSRGSETHDIVEASMCLEHVDDEQNANQTRDRDEQTMGLTHDEQNATQTHRDEQTMGRTHDEPNVDARGKLLKSYEHHIGELIMLGEKGKVLETNTFHLPFGEMTITLEDVMHITRLPITGSAIGRVNGVTKEEFLEWCYTLLGITKEDTSEEMKITKGKYVRMDWLCKYLEGTACNEIPDSVDYDVRGYLLFVLGCTIFPDKSGTQVNLIHLYFLRDIEALNKFAWGVAALAYLYRQLGAATRTDAASISGYLTLLNRTFMSMIARQFGHVQLLPRDPLEPVECNRTKSNLKIYTVSHDEPEANYERWKDHIVTSEARGPKAVHPHDCVPDYETWFRTHSYPMLISKRCLQNNDAVEPILP